MAGPRVRGRGNRQKPRHYSGPRADRPGKRPEGKRHTQPRHADARAQRTPKTGRHDQPSFDDGPPTLAPDAGPKAAQFSAAVQTVVVVPDEAGMRVDRFFEARFPGLSFSHIQRIIRKGEVRVNGKRTQPKARLEAGQTVRIPPLKVDAPAPRNDAPQAQKDRAFVKSITLYEDADVLVLNKPMGLAVQGGSGTTRHIDGMLGALRGPGPDAQRPRLVHRLDKDTAGCLLVAKTRFAAAALAKTFRSRSARKIYWALVVGVPKPQQGRISTFLAKQEVEEDSFMRIAKHGEKDAVHAVTYYAVVEAAGGKAAFVALMPVTGRTHQLRAHCVAIGTPLLGDGKYGGAGAQLAGVPGERALHLHARSLTLPHPRGGMLSVVAPLPPHMAETWRFFGFAEADGDPFAELAAEAGSAKR